MRATRRPDRNERREPALIRDDGWDEAADEAWQTERPAVTLADVAGWRP